MSDSQNGVATSAAPDREPDEERRGDAGDRSAPLRDPAERPAQRRPEGAPSLRLAGPLLSALHRLSAMPGTNAVVRALVNETLGIRALAKLPDVFRGELPDDLRPVRARSPRRWSDERAPASEPGRWPRATRHYLRAYAEGRAAPSEVVERALTALMGLARRSPPMNVLASCDPESVRREAVASEARIARGQARPLEGVPLLVKDQHDVAGLTTRFGSRHLPHAATKDATIVARLRRAGAIVLGKSVMTEWGISPIGTNVHFTMPRNVHDPGRAAGGSSTGSAIAVSLGIGPFATSGDAGGSTRLPAAWSGVFGLKPTFGRISREGEIFSGSLNHLGIIAVCAEDIARILDVVASQPDPADVLTSWADPPPLAGFGARLGDGVRGLRIGVDERDWDDCSPDIASACRAALSALEHDGAIVVPVRIPLARHAVALGIATIGGEGAALAQSIPAARCDDLAIDLRLAMNVASGLSAVEYLDVQRLRAGLRQQLAAALRTVDVIASPTVSTPPPRLSSRELTSSFSDANLVLAICRHTFLANLTGTPAASAPVGVDAHGVPIGLQLLGDAWDEAGLLAVLAHLERAGVARVIQPRGAVDLLSSE